MWLDASKEPEFAGQFKQETYPHIVVLNPGKRKRYLIHEEAHNAAGLRKTLELILSGDARFKAVAGNKLPNLVSAYPTKENPTFVN